MKKYLFVYDARMRNGQGVGNVVADLPALSWAAIRGVQDRIKLDVSAENVVITNVIELEG